jgi:hypothetical protein
MGSVTEDVAANLAAELAAAVAADNEKATLLGGEVRADKPQPETTEEFAVFGCAARVGGGGARTRGAQVARQEASHDPRREARRLRGRLFRRRRRRRRRRRWT